MQTLFFFSKIAIIFFDCAVNDFKIDNSVVKIGEENVDDFENFQCWQIWQKKSYRIYSCTNLNSYIFFKVLYN